MLGIPNETDNVFSQYYDVTGDGEATPLDALRVINQLARQSSGAPSGEGEQPIETPRIERDRNSFLMESTSYTDHWYPQALNEELPFLVPTDPGKMKPFLFDEAEPVPSFAHHHQTARHSSITDSVITEINEELDHGQAIRLLSWDARTRPRA